jgi:sigma-E factor negative regulatory protein RseA
MEKISHLMDGELDGKAAAGAIDALEREGEALDAWRMYHLISDAMRDTRMLSPGFAQRVADALAKEPTVVAPRRLLQEPRPERQRVALPAAAAASVAAVGLVGWLAFSPAPEPGTAQMARTPSVQSVLPPVVSLRPPTVPLPSAMPDYLLAHQGFSPRLSLHGMAPYARTVSEQVNEGRK